MKHTDHAFIGDQESLRQINLSTVLTHLRQNAPISRAALAEMTGLNRATITRLVRELIEHGFVRETGFQSLRSGRPSILLQLDPEAGCIIGAEIEVKFGSVILTDLAAHVIWRQEVDFGNNDEPEAVLNSTAQLIKQACSKAAEKNRHVLGLGISLPGLVDVSSGVLLFAPNMRWSEVPVKQWLEKEFDIPIYVDNKANMAALAESYFGSARDSEYVLYINITAGVGSGIVLNQRIMTGVSGLAGEVGHMTINPDGPKCNCGSYGCWETYVSALAVFRRVRECILQGDESQLSEVVQDGFERITIPLMVEAARNGDRVAIESLEETGYYLGVGLANLINTFNPQKVVLGGYVTQAYEFLLPIIQKTVKERALRWPREAADIVVATYLNEASLMGAVATVYSQILSNPNQAFRAKRGLLPSQEVIRK
ncbi:MAG TPA: ROK family transcriptional regulator [Anaerolineales bacterium]|nr:ROK family transcriptional regulator [Anaerolineales bacterium]